MSDNGCDEQLERDALVVLVHMAAKLLAEAVPLGYERLLLSAATLLCSSHHILSLNF